MACHSFDNLVSNGGNARVANSDGIEWLEIMNKVQGVLCIGLVSVAVAWLEADPQAEAGRF